VLEAEKNWLDLKDFDKAQTVMLESWGAESLQLQLLWDVSGLQGSGSNKRCPAKENR